MIRAMQQDDYEQLKYIHEKYYADEFSFPDFVTKYLCAFVVTDNYGDIITAGGVRTIAESVALTNKDYSVRERRKALYQLLETSVFLTHRCGYDQLHAFIQDEHWSKHLKETGFSECVGKPLYIRTGV